MWSKFGLFYYIPNPKQLLDSWNWKIKLTEKNKLDRKTSKQLSIDNFHNRPLKQTGKNHELIKISSIENVPSHKRQIILTKIYLENHVNESTLKVDFKLLPNKSFFSKIKSDLWFDKKRVQSVLFDIMHSFGSTDEFSLKVTLDPNGITPGLHLVKVEMKEVSSLRKKQIDVVKEIMVDFERQIRKSRLRKIKLVKKVEGQGIVIISNKDKDIIGIIRANKKNDLLSKRDTW